MNPRQRVFAAFDHEETDCIPIYTPSFERSAVSYQSYRKWQDSQLDSDSSPSSNIALIDWQEARFWDADLWPASPFPPPILPKKIPSPLEYPNARLKITGTIKIPQVQSHSGDSYYWYHDGYFKTKEILQTYWTEYGKPSTWIDETITYSRSKWINFSTNLENYFVPFVSLPFTLFEALFEGMTLGRLRYYMGKDPNYIHSVASEYTAANLAFIELIADAGVEVVFFFDDLGQKDRPLLSLSPFREFILPEYKKIYQACRKKGLICVHHCCGKMDLFLPDMIQAGLQALQSLEPASGMDLSIVKNNYGDKITLMGGIDSTNILNFGTSAQIIEHVQKVIEIGRINHGFFIGPAHNLLNTPWENIITLKNAIKRFR